MEPSNHLIAFKPHGWLDLAEAVDAEIDRAKKKFPTAMLHAGAMIEEAGEAFKEAMNLYHLGEALKEQQRLSGKSYQEINRLCVEIDRTRTKLRKELVQTIAMCVCLENQGDPTLNVEPAR